MAALAKDTPRVFEIIGAEYWNDLPMSAVVAYEGSAMSINAGNMRPLNVADTANGFAGFLEKQVDNSAGAAGDKKGRVRQRGAVVLNVVGVTSVANVTAPVYATDSGTFTLTASGGMQIGKIGRHESGTRCVVNFEAAALRLG